MTDIDKITLATYQPWNVLTGLQITGQVWWDRPGWHPGSDALARMALTRQETGP